MTEKRFNVFDVDGTIFLEDHEKGSYHIGELGNVNVNCLNSITYRLNELHEENQHLKETLNELKKIDDYKDMRMQDLYDTISLMEDEIDKKITVLTGTKIKSFQNGDEELLEKIKFSIQVLRELKEVILE